MLLRICTSSPSTINKGLKTVVALATQPESLITTLIILGSNPKDQLLEVRHMTKCKSYQILVPMNLSYHRINSRSSKTTSNISRTAILMTLTHQNLILITYVEKLRIIKPQLPKKFIKDYKIKKICSYYYSKSQGQPEKIQTPTF